MSRTLKLSIAPHREGGLALTVTHTARVGDDDNSITTTERIKDDLGSDAAIKLAAARAVEEYLVRILKDSRAAVEQSPISKAIARA